MSLRPPRGLLRVFLTAVAIPFTAGVLPVHRAEAGDQSVTFRQGEVDLRASQRKKIGRISVANAAPTRSISMKEAIELALQNNLEARIERVGIRISHARVRFAAGAFDPVFAINSSYQSVRRLQNIDDVDSEDVIRQQQAISSNFALAQAVEGQAIAQANQTNALRALQGLPPLAVPEPTVVNQDTVTNDGLSTTTFSSESFRFDTSLQGRTPLGTQYQFNIQANRLRNTFTGDTREVIPEYQSFVGFTVIQPLLRNFGPGANLAELRLSRLNKQSQVLEWKQQVTTAVQGVMATYFEMLAAQADIGVREDAVAQGQRLVTLYRRRVDLGFNSPLDIQQAEVAVSTEREALIAARNTFMERQFALKRLILEEFQASDARVLLPVAHPNLTIPDLDRSRWLQLAFENRYDYKRAILDAESQNIRLRYFKNQLLPRLDLVGTFGLNGLDTNFGSSFDRAFQGREPSWSVGVNFEVPLANLQARARYTEALGLKEQAILRLKQSELTVSVDVDTILSRIETSRQRVDTARQTRNLGDEAVRVSYRRLEEGQISSFDIIDEQQKLFNARTRELSAISELNRAITQLWLVSGTVLERQGITFTDAVPASETRRVQTRSVIIDRSKGR